MTRAVVTILFIVIVIGYAVSRFQGGDQLAAAAITPDFPAETHQQIVADAINDVSLANMRWRKAGFGVVAYVTATIKNNHSTSVHDIELTCDFYGPSGTVINENSATVYETIPAYKTKTLHEVSLGFIDQQVTNAGCRIGDLKF